MQLTLSEADFQRLAQFMHATFGIDLSKKRQLIASRLSTPIQQRGYHSFTEFIDHLLHTRDSDELTLVQDKLTTNYTYFMREEEHFTFFSQVILPDIVRRHQQDKVLAIWSAGCSSGEEPYNISMCIMDYLGPQAAQWDTRVLATDISHKVLAKARQGLYELPDTIPPAWKHNYFRPTAAPGVYQVAPKIRDNVIFQVSNLMDPIRFKLKFDVIFCRNVMIYFDQPTKDALVRRFYNATVPGGYLLISFSENLSPNAPYRRLRPSTFQK